MSVAQRSERSITDRVAERCDDGPRGLLGHINAYLKLGLAMSWAAAKGPHAGVDPSKKINISTLVTGSEAEP